MTVLSVNLNKIAVLRNSRGGQEPSLEVAAEAVIAAGAGGITLHPRPDQRHVRPGDVHDVARLLRNRVDAEYVALLERWGCDVVTTATPEEAEARPVPDFQASAERNCPPE